MKLVVLLGLSATALAATCGDIGAEGRNKAHFCSGDLVLDESNLTTECPLEGCTDAVCCVEPEATPEVVVEEEKGPSEVVVAPTTPSYESGTCSNVLSGSRPSRHVCGDSHVFDYTKANAVCGADGCDDETCCRAADPLHDCSTSIEEFSPAKARFCCIEEGIACQPHVCAAGAGILSDDETVCCQASCGTCGGQGCYGRPGGEACCKTLIRDMDRPCGFYSAPCSNMAIPQLIPRPIIPQPMPLPAPIFSQPVPLPAPIFSQPVPLPAPIFSQPVLRPAPAPTGFDPRVGLYTPMYTTAVAAPIARPFRASSLSPSLYRTFPY